MKTKYLNLFWALLATVILIYEFTYGQVDSFTIFGKQFNLWLLALVWGLVAIKNYFSFYSKVKS